MILDEEKDLYGLAGKGQRFFCILRTGEMSYKRIGFGKRVVLVLSLVLLWVSAGAVFADVKLPAVISDNMVLQRGMEVPIWGWAEPGEHIAVMGNWQGRGSNTIANQNGKWMVSSVPLVLGGLIK